jgi:4-amino-4-deoxy-L-arabinose transferase-like glycosyltransferase
VWIVAFFLVLSVLLKFYHFTAPALDWQSWKQTGMLSKARYIYRDGLISFFVPRQDLFQGLDLESNRAFAEVPLPQLLWACGYWLIGHEAEWVGRLWAIAFSLAGGCYLAALAYRRVPALAGVVALAIYALSPYDTYFYRTVISDVPMTACAIMGLYHFVRWLETGRSRDAMLCAVGTALAAVFKVYALFIGVAYVWLIVRRCGWRALFRPAHLAIAAGAVAPIAAWLVYGYLNFPDDPADVGRNLTASTELFGRWSILVDREYYDRLWVRMGDFGLTPFLGLLFLISAGCALWGVFGSKGPRAASDAGWTRAWPDWLVGWWLGALVYLGVMRQANWEHDYYQMCLLAPLALGAGLGVDAWWHWIGRWDRRAKSPRPGGRRATWGWLKWTTVGLGAISVFYGEYQAYDGIGRAMQQVASHVFHKQINPNPGKYKLELDSYFAGRAIAAVRQDDEKTLFVETGGLRRHQLLYYSGGRGWMLPPEVHSIEDLRPYIERGARYFAVSVAEADWDQDPYPLPLVRSLVAAGHLTEIAHSSDQLDRYDRPRNWAVYRIVP